MATNIDKVLKSVLETATGVSVYALQKPLTADLPAVVYMRVSDIPQISMSGTSGSVRVRFQIACIANTYTRLRTLVANVESGLVVNTTDWSVSQPLDGQFEDKDDNAKIYTSIRDYFIWYKV